MGLDMYLSAQRYMSEYSNPDEFKPKKEGADQC